ncbi:MAG: BamA/OMP85 family outer membrane protein [bacterium]
MKKLYLLTFLLVFLLISSVMPLNAEINTQIISGIAIKGNDILSDQEIMDLIETEIGEYLNEDKIRSDLQSIYDTGYYEDLSVSYQAYQGGVKLIFNLVEYPVLTDIILEGNQSYSDQELLDLIEFEKDKVFNLNTFFQELSKVIKMYHENGYVFTKFNDFHISEDGILTVELNEGYINDIIIEGNDRTHDYVIKREINFSQGDVINTEKIQTVLRGIWSLQIFQDLNSGFEPANEDDNLYDLVISVEEAKAGKFLGGVTWDSADGWIGNLNIQNKNLFGNGQSVNFGWEFGGVSNYSINFREPWLFGSPIALNLGIYDKRVERTDNDKGEYEENRQGGSIGLEHSLVNDWKAGIKYRIKDSIVNYKEYKDDDGNFLSESSSVRSLKLHSSRNTTNDPFNPTNGAMDIFSIEYAGQILGGDASFNKYVYDLRRYCTGFRDNDAWGLRTKVGFSNGDLPTLEKYRLGGPSSLRGYEQGSFTGEELLLFQAEYRLAIDDNFTGVVFTDAGNVWDKKEDIDLRDLRYSYGAGLRLNTQLGQISFDYGFNELGEGQPQFSIGHAF